MRTQYVIHQYLRQTTQTADMFPRSHSLFYDRMKYVRIVHNLFASNERLRYAYAIKSQIYSVK